MSTLELQILPSETYVTKKHSRFEEEVEEANSIVVYSDEVALPIQVTHYSESTPVTVYYKGNTITGILLSSNENELTLLTEDGTRVKTKYQSIGYPAQYNKTKVTVLDKSHPDIELCYRTAKITWSPQFYINCNIHESSTCTNSSWGKITLVADVDCDYLDPITGDVILVAQDRTRHSPQPYYTRSLMAASSPQAMSYESNSDSPEGVRSDINYNMGVRTLERHQSWNLRSKEVALDLVQFIPLNSWGRSSNSSGYAERAIIFYAPFYMISGTSNLHITTEKGVLRNTLNTDIYQEGQLVRLTLGGSTLVNYVNEYTTKEYNDSIITTGTLTIKSKTNVCILIGMERRGNLKITSPEPNKKLSTSSTVYWNIDVDSKKEYIFKYTYQVN